LRELGVDRLLVLVSERPGHKPTVADPETRLELAQLAFQGLPQVDVRLDPHPFTADFLREERPQDAVLVIGADQWAAFDTWCDPDEVKRMIQIAVAARPGQTAPQGTARTFEIDQLPISSSEIRAKVAAGEPIDDLVPPLVAREIERRGLYAGGRG
jgi:nicotinate-nucleotide adenylyltransferase